LKGRQSHGFKSVVKNFGIKVRKKRKGTTQTKIDNGGVVP